MTSFLRWSALLLLLSLLAASPGLTQEQQPADPSTGTTLLTVAGLEAKIKALEESSPDEPDREELLKLYRDALSSVQAAAQWKDQAAAFEAARDSAPQRLESARQELARPEEEIRIEPSPQASLSELGSSLSDAKVALTAARAEKKNLDDKADTRASRRKELSTEVSAARKELETVTNLLAQPAAEGANPEVRGARQAQLRARELAAEQHLAALSAEQASYEARGDLLTAQRDLAARKLARTEKLTAAWQTLVDARREKDVQAATAQAQETLADVEAIPQLAELAHTNASLTRERSDLTQKLGDLAQSIAAAVADKAQLQNSYNETRNRVKIAGGTDALGLLLGQQKVRVAEYLQLEKELKRRDSEAAQAQIRILELGIMLDILRALDEPVKQVVESVRADGAKWSADRLEEEVRRLLKDRRQYAADLRKDHEASNTKLVDLYGHQKEILSIAQAYAEFIDERILWIRSARPIWQARPRELVEAVGWLASPSSWQMVVRESSRNPYLIGAAILAALGFFLLRPRLVNGLQKLGDTAAVGSCFSILPTLKALVVTAIMASFVPGLFLIAAWQMRETVDPTGFRAGLAGGFTWSAVLLAIASFHYRLCGPRGLARSHFKWRPEGVAVARRQLRWLVPVTLVLGWFYGTCIAQPDDDRVDTLGRVFFLLLIGADGVFLHLLLSPRSRIWAPATDDAHGEWARRRRWFYHLLAVAIPLGLIGLALMGYFFTARRLAGELLWTCLLVLALVQVKALAMRTLVVARRKLLYKQVQERLAAREEAEDAEEAEEAEARAEEEAVDVDTLDLQVKQLLRSLLQVTSVVGIWLLWSDELPALGFLNTVNLWSTGTDVDGVKVYVTLTGLLLAILTLVLTILATKNLPGLLELAILQKLPLQAGVRYAITTVARYIITLVGIIWAFGQIGIGWSNVQWLAAAVTVGLGFGLQEIFANFVSGLIILFERPVRVGDIITVAGVDGRVARIRMRATTITDWDQREFLVPNKEFVTGSLINWTLSDMTTRVVIPVGVAYGSDVRLARNTLLKVARANPWVMNDPQPSAIFKRFGDSTLDLDLRVFLADRDDWAKLIDSLHTTIDDEFRKNGIEIAFPQRDLHIRTAGGLKGFLRQRAARSTEAEPESLSQP